MKIIYEEIFSFFIKNAKFILLELNKELEGYKILSNIFTRIEVFLNKTNWEEKTKGESE